MKLTNRMKLDGEIAARSLSEGAADFYNNADPLTLYEYDTDTGKRYTLTGVIERQDLTFDEVDEVLRSCGEELQ